MPSGQPLLGLSVSCAEREGEQRPSLLCVSQAVRGGPSRLKTAGVRSRSRRTPAGRRPSSLASPGSSSWALAWLALAVLGAGARSVPQSLPLGPP